LDRYRRRTLQHGQHHPRFHRRRLFHHQRSRRLRHHRSHVEDVSAEGRREETIVQTYFIEFSYLLASILFILGLKGMSHPETAKRGMHMAEFGMLMAIIGTLMHFEIVSYTWIIVGLLVGGLLGSAMCVWVRMTAMPQRTALSHAFGAFAAALVGIAEYYSYTHG